MKLQSLKIRNFRAYQDEIEITFNNLTALIGRNDVGKTTILDALGIFFGHKLCKYEPGDKCVYAGENDDVIITCVFYELPDELILDATSRTTLESEFLLDAEGTLSLFQEYSKKVKALVLMLLTVYTHQLV